MQSYSNYRINPLVKIQTTDTLLHCSHCLSYIAESITGLSEADTPITAYQGLQSLVECIQLAIDYETYRLQDHTQPVLTQ